ncbi:Uncharacterised protein [Mycobacterium tuberculosis]|uniref:Uncharacterized protein n=1 Tax=Mycobacterium tuberculosis TaxID=1773 RepID=A0A0U0QLI0_MYCTX|nr:Uncharacterised protein [Mycobacterium tuberculosis]CKO94516.1 Uncharacterised protein [Mycobacterium tuberculosis]CKR18156.1 Uncharacterised protein [Mycobacterium tuberculosis]CKS28851.1 Uncharacterised protein [Mycobacterium tuberculosis]CNM53383.1 Uncharacterised protein [Mycobacterium tuberculosis]
MVADVVVVDVVGDVVVGDVVGALSVLMLKLQPASARLSATVATAAVKCFIARSRRLDRHFRPVRSD